MLDEIERMSATKRSTSLKLGELELGNFNIMLQKEDDILVENSSENEES